MQFGRQNLKLGHWRSGANACSSGKFPFRVVGLLSNQSSPRQTCCDAATGEGRSGAGFSCAMFRTVILTFSQLLGEDRWRSSETRMHVCVGLESFAQTQPSCKPSCSFVRPSCDLRAPSSAFVQPSCAPSCALRASVLLGACLFFTRDFCRVWRAKLKNCVFGTVAVSVFFTFLARILPFAF